MSWSRIGNKIKSDWVNGKDIDMEMSNYFIRFEIYNEKDNWMKFSFFFQMIHMHTTSFQKVDHYFNTAISKMNNYTN